MTALRSYLFIPGDSEKKLGKGQSAGADALVLDLEDAVAPDRKPAARGLVNEYLKNHPAGARSPQLWVRVNPLSSGMMLDDLAGVMEHAPDGIMIPKPDGPQDVLVLSQYLDAFEAAYGIPCGRTKVLPVATETAVAPFRLGEYATARLTRLIGLTWGAEDLSAAVRASTNLGPDGGWAETYRMVRSMTLLAAHAADVAAIETLYSDFRDEKGLRASCRAARSEGFSGRIAIHPSQVQAINECFSPSKEEIAEARRIIAAFDAADGAGTVGLDGRMLDIPHLKQAQYTVELAEAIDE